MTTVRSTALVLSLHWIDQKLWISYVMAGTLLKDELRKHILHSICAVQYISEFSFWQKVFDSFLTNLLHYCHTRMCVSCFILYKIPRFEFLASFLKCEFQFSYFFTIGTSYLANPFQILWHISQMIWRCDASYKFYVDSRIFGLFQMLTSSFANVTLFKECHVSLFKST